MEELRSLLGGNYRENEPMSSHTSFRAGGRADYYLTPDTFENFCQTIKILNDKSLPYIVLGNATNVIVLDGGIAGAVVSTIRLTEIRLVKDSMIYAQAGVLLSKLATYAKDNSLSGLSFAHGIPGSVGGAVVMNAGAYGGEMSQVVLNAECIVDGMNVASMPSYEIEFGYRSSVFQKNRMIVLGAFFSLQEGDKVSIQSEMDDLARKRKEKQPLNLPSAGSVFKRPEGYFTGSLIENAGLKGMKVGGAMVSEKHAGFIVNIGNATAADFINLVELVQNTVFSKFGVMLETEVKTIGIN